MRIFQNKKVLITGHTGFKGSWLAKWLDSLGANVVGVSLEPPSQPSHFMVAGLASNLEDHRINIQNGEALKSLLSEAQPDFVFHLAAQSLVYKSYLCPLETYSTNVIGTLNLLEALRTIKNTCTVVLITSDKCYENVEWVWGYRETDMLGGLDPYSASKAATELLIRSHIKSFFPKDGGIRIAIGRAGNVIGGGDWAANRIVPDCVRSWSEGKSVQIRNPLATRPWQHVLEPLSGYLLLATKLYQRKELHGEPFNFGPSTQQDHTVLELVKAMSAYWDKVRWENVSDSVQKPYESSLLKLNCEKAQQNLNWQAVMTFKETVRMTAEWYRSYYENPSSIGDVTLSHIKEFVNFSKNKGFQWEF